MLKRPIPAYAATLKHSSFQGSIAYPFDRMVKDTIAAHGWEWAFRHYVVKGGLKAWEFDVFSGCGGFLCVKEEVVEGA